MSSSMTAGIVPATEAAEFRIVDSHVNAGTGELESDPIKSKITPEYLLQLMAESGVAQSVIFPASRPGGYSEANREIAEYVRKRPDRFIGFARIRSRPVIAGETGGRPSRRRAWTRMPAPVESIVKRLENRIPAVRGRNPPELDDRCRDELATCFDEYGLRGVKVHPLEDGYPGKAVAEVLHSCNRPLLLHCGRGISFTRIENEIIKPYRMPVILAHMGGYPADRKLYFRALELATRFPHVYLNTSFVFYTYILEQAIKSCPTKILFGSDSPGVHPYTAVATILPLRVPDEVKRMVFCDNLMELLEI